MKEKLSSEVHALLLKAQKSEITEYFIYSKLARRIKDQKNSQVLGKIAADELAHYKFWKRYTGQEVKTNKWKIFFFYWISLLFGLTFGIKLLERGEEEAQINYEQIANYIPEAQKIIADEDEHEDQLIALLEEEHLQYVGSVVLGLNDALVELTGTLAGLSLALKDTRLIALAGLVTGIAASFSMAASEYLSTKSEGKLQEALKSSFYTGVTYLLTVFFLILPYLLLDNYLYSLLFTILVAIMIIFIFNYYISVAKDLDFKQRFTEMTAISLGVALFSFGIGLLVRTVLGVDI